MLRHNARPISKGTMNTDWGPVELCVYEESFPTEAVWSGNTPGSGMMSMLSAVEVYWEKKDIWAFAMPEDDCRGTRRRSSLYENCYYRMLEDDVYENTFAGRRLLVLELRHPSPFAFDHRIYFRSSYYRAFLLRCDRRMEAF